MAGRLKPDAKCPVCLKDLAIVTRITYPAEGSARLEFDHGAGTRDCRIVGPIETLDKLHDSLHFAHPVICIGMPTISRLAAGEEIAFEEHNVSLIAADDIFHKTVEVK